MFLPHGTCNRGESCPFFHDPNSKPAAEAKPAAASGSAKAIVAIISAAQGVSRASATSHGSSGSGGRNVLLSSLHMITKPFMALASLFSCIGQPQLSAHPAALLANPALVSNSATGVAMSAKMAESFNFEWIADSGAGRDLGSERAFLEQGIPKDLVESCAKSAKPIKFETGNGTFVSGSCIDIPGSTFGNASFQAMDDCPVLVEDRRGRRATIYLDPWKSSAFRSQC